jgi:hypothetical protein
MKEQIVVRVDARGAASDQDEKVGMAELRVIVTFIACRDDLDVVL